MLSIVLQVFLISFLINLLWEVIHSQLYTTCLKAPLKKYIPLIIGASLKDGWWISLLFGITVILFRNINILSNLPQLIFFVVLSLAFSFYVEKTALKKKRWEYAKQMPTIFGVGITPLLEIAITGIVAFLYVFLV
jgi:hypothetical protein